MLSFALTCAFVLVVLIGFARMAWRHRRREPSMVDPTPAIREAGRATGERFHRVRKRRNTELDQTFPELAEEAARKALLS